MKKISGDIELAICEDYSQRITLNDICKKYNIDRSVIYRLLKKYDINKHRDNTDVVTEKVANLYKSGKSCTQIGKELKMSRNTVSDYLKSSNIVVDADRHKRVYTIDESIFKIIDTPEKAQILGLIYADGCILKDYDVTIIALKEDDLSYLKKINEYMNYTRPVRLDKKSRNRYFKENSKTYLTKNAYAIRIHNKKIKNDLINHGVVPNKSDYDFDFPNMTENLFSSFILGYFEGDGCVTTSKLKNRKTKSKSFSILGQSRMINSIHDKLKNVGIGSKIYTRKARPNLRTLAITKGGDLIKLYKWLYKDVSFCMIRKHDKFKEILNFMKTYKYDIGDFYNFD